MVTATHDALLPRTRWNWLWGAKSDLTWNFAPFWAGFLIAFVAYFARNLGGMNDNPVWNLRLFGHNIHIAALILYFYSPIVDAPHLWATVARTYTDKEEWAQRRRLFLGSLAWFVIGPVVILLPYLLHATVGFPAAQESLAWLVWTRFFELYALFHIAKQHWGFVALYKRKNGDMADELENRVDALFFKTALWLPYIAMLAAPWYVDFDGKPFTFLSGVLGGRTYGEWLHAGCNVVLLAMCVAYAFFQVDQWRKGKVRNGPKLLYIGTLVALYFVTFAVDERVAVFWLITTGIGHCAQYHRVVWAYGATKYAPQNERTLPVRIFKSPALYISLGVVFGIVTLQGPVGFYVQHAIGVAFDRSGLHGFFSFLNHDDAVTLGARLVAAFAGGTRLHHFFVDSKIWRVSKNAALAKNLNVAA